MFFCAVVERESAEKKATVFVRWVRAGCERELRIVFRGKAEIVEREIVLMVVRMGKKFQRNIRRLLLSKGEM